MTATSFSCLSLERAMEYVGDQSSVMALLGTLRSSLESDLPRIHAHLQAGDLAAANGLLHQLKGFAPVFCVDSLVQEVTAVEKLSKGPDLEAVRLAYQHLAPRLQQWLQEVVIAQSGVH